MKLGHRLPSTEERQRTAIGSMVNGTIAGASKIGMPVVEVQRIPIPAEEPEACPVLIDHDGGSYGIPAGVNSTATVLYTVSGNTLHLVDWPATTSISDVDLDPAMDSLGAAGGGNIRTGVIAGDGLLYAAGFITDPSNFQLFKVELDGTNPDLLWTANATTGTAGSIGWHTDDPDFIYLLYTLTSGTSRFSKIHRSTGAETILFTAPGTALGGLFTLQQWGGGFVPYVDEVIYTYTMTGGVDDSLAAPGFDGMGTRSDGLTIYVASSVRHAFTVSGAGVITEIDNPCADAWDAGGLNPPFYWFADPDRDHIYVGTGFHSWEWE